MNRLKLDFSLDTTTQRSDFLKNYLTDPQFTKCPPTPAELETMANYVLWGKDPISGKNVVQEKTIQIETRNSTWSAPSASIESYDALIESPTFNEAQFTQSATVPTRHSREVFSRSAARQQCPTSLLPTLEDLWRRIDWLDLAICYYELDHDKRQNPPRPKLLSKFTTDEQLRIHEKTKSWSMYHYLKNRHLLGELRREQYTIRDSFTTSLLPNTTPAPIEPEPAFSFGSDVTVLPLGLKTEKNSLFFKEKDQLNPHTYSEDDLIRLNDLYWSTRRALKPYEGLSYESNNSLWSEPHSQFVIDFRNPAHVAALLSKFSDFQDDINSLTPDEAGANPFQLLYDTMLYYLRFTELDQIQTDLISFKLQRRTNPEIADYLNKHYGRAYTPNYISTVFRQRIIPKVAEAARAHYEQVGSLFFPEDFKTCNTCGKVLLRTEDNFMHRTRSRDGFSNRCKRCDSLARKKPKKGGN
jgi:hypothetical protein